MRVVRHGSAILLALASLFVFTGTIEGQSCDAPDPANRPQPAVQFITVVVDSSGSMTTAVPGAPPSCVGYPSDRFGHARCAVKKLFEGYSDKADFGLAQFATFATGVTHPCYGSASANCYQEEINTTGQCAGCGPRPGNSATRAGARILVPVTSNDNLLKSYVDNVCNPPTEIGPPIGSTPLNGALRDMKRYYQSTWTAPDGSVTFQTPFAGNTLSCRRGAVILLTDGDETCDSQTDAVVAAADLFQNGVVVAGVNYKIRTYVINFAGGTVANTDAIASAGGTGASIVATSEAQLTAAFNDIMSRKAETLNGSDDDCNGCVDDGLSVLTLQKTVSPASARRGAELTYTITANNAGPTVASATVRDTLPPALTFVSLNSPAGWSCTTAGEIRCTNPLFAVNSPAVFTIRATISASAPLGGTITNTARIEAAFGASAPVQSSVNAIVLTNQTPLANAGPNQSLAAGSTCSVDAQLDGSASSDPDGDALTYRWSRAGFADLTGVSPTVTLGPGSHTFTLVVTDSQGASSAPASVTILVTDTIAPLITAPPVVTLQSDPASCSASAAGQLGTPSGSDECGPVTFTRTPATDTFPLGTTTVVWTATDGDGNTTPATQSVTVVDATAPSITAPPDVSRATPSGATSCALVISDAELGTASASDACGTANITRTGVPAGNLFPVGQTVVTYTATDAAGNSASATQTVTVSDGTAPSVTAPPAITLATAPGATSCSLVIPDATLGAASASDNCGGVNVTRSGVPAGNSFPVGTTTIVYTATDANGNSSTATQTVTVSDGTAPALTLLGSAVMTLSCRAAFTEPGATALDNCDGDRTAGIIVTGVVDDTTPGTYTRTYTVTDSNGNTTTKQRTVIVQDDAPPVIQSSSVTPNELWPPNHKMVPVTVTVSATDVCSGAGTGCAIVGVSSNEPINGLGDGDTAPDWQIVSPTTVLLRAERAGTRSDRIYTITVRCTDGAGQATETTLKVKVPKSR